ncbi:MAG: TonB-dependent receptor, partial [Rhodothermales bacterium]
MTLLLWAGTTSISAQNTASISGVVTDAENGEPLTGANIILTTPGAAGIVGGAAADLDGRYSIQGVTPGSYTLTVRFVGYNESQTTVVLAAGESASQDIQLSIGGLDLNTIVISASRQAEKVLDAPASISVLDAREVQQEVVPSTISVLRNTTGVDMAQTGVDRNEVVLRGFNNAFSGSAYILTDYRQTAVPSLNVNIHSIMPTMSIDIERVEVVRGPGSALYGAGVDEGVIHFITKDPFSFPGTTVSVTGGERSLLGVQFRHAGNVNNKFGYKITGKYSQAEDWELDPNNTEDAVQLNRDAQGFERNYDFQKFNINGMAQYKISDNVSLTANAGTASLDAVVLSGIGTLQADGFSNTYGQLRLQADRLFAQVYASQNDAKDSFVYGTGSTVVDNGTELNAQAQYDLDFADERVRVIIGADYQQTNPDTEGTILGRNEADDEIVEAGGYVQSTIELTSKLDLTVAARGDYSNIFDFRMSPRAAIVYKANNQNTFRASFNRAFSSPGPNSLFLDIVGQSTPVSATQQFLIMGRGSADGFTFDNFRSTNSARFFLPV